MSSLNSRQNMLIAFLVVLLALVLVYFNFTSPAIAKKEAKAKELAQKQQELKELQQKLERLTSASPSELVKLMQVRRQIPEQENVESLLREMRMLEVVSHTEMSKYEYEIGKKQSGNQSQDNGISPLVTSIKMSPTVEGDYNEIYRMLEEMQTSERLLTIDKITFNNPVAPPVQINAPKKDLKCVIDFTAYYSPYLQRYFNTPAPIDYTAPGGRANPIY